MELLQVEAGRLNVFAFGLVDELAVGAVCSQQDWAGAGAARAGAVRIRSITAKAGNLSMISRMEHGVR